MPLAFPGERMSAPKKLYVKTYGCQMNVYDSERMTAALAARGYEATAAPEDADLVLLNTCHIREKAAEKVYSELGRLQRAEGAEARSSGSGSPAASRRPRARRSWRGRRWSTWWSGRRPITGCRRCSTRREAGERPVETEFPAEDKFDHLPQDRRARRAPAAFLTVQEGCDKFCAFCVVPYTRGAEVSRPAARVEAEARDLVGARRRRDHAARAERERLPRPGRRRAGGAGARGSRRSRGSSGSATPPRIRTTWTTT